ncbi:hypothetical protein ACSSNL_08470 [Thalassobius sp. S69A]|uniref:hypothetical protein n=1 Tax=unclassified Thalassovita TaxID=2619711 RepID=UPI000C10132A|nr:hypothetical protein [Paracoccaceae bacterium]MBT26372.1 hypothetical protein [Paracoccaceae bacterium]
MPPADHTPPAEPHKNIQQVNEDITEQKASLQAALSQVQDTQDDIRRQVDAYALEVASRRGYERTVGLVMTAGAALSIGVGVFFSFMGMSKLSDFEDRVQAFADKADKTETQMDDEIEKFTTTMDTTIDNKIALFLNRSKKQSDRYQEQFAKTDALIRKLQAAEIRWQQIKPALDGLDGYDPDEDLKGDFERLTADTKTFSRAEKVGIVRRISDHLREVERNGDVILQFTPDDIFNAAQMARGLKRVDLEKALVQAAYELDSSSLATQAQYLQLQTRLGPLDQREARFGQLMGLIAQPSMDAPHIVLAEAWNAAEGQRRYTDFLAAVDARILAAQADTDMFLPSHFHAIKGNAHQRRGLPNELPIAMRSYIHAIEQLAKEGTHTQWAVATIRDTVEGLEQLLLSGVDISPALRAAERSGIPDLNNALKKKLQSFLQTAAPVALTQVQ